MKKEELTALGITDEQAEKVLEMHGKDQNEAASKLSEAENKLAAAEKNAKELTEKVKAFDGVDLEALRKSAADWETKYNTDIAKAKLDSAVELALTRAGAKDVDLARHLIDTSILKLDGDKVVGLAEQLEKAKTDKAFLSVMMQRKQQGSTQGSTTAELPIQYRTLRSEPLWVCPLKPSDLFRRKNYA